MMKKHLSFLLAALLAILASTTAAFAMKSPTPTGMIGPLALGYSGHIAGDTVDLEDIQPQDELIEYIYLYADMFEWSDGEPATHTQLTASQIRDGKLAVRSSGGGKVLDEVTINNREGRVEVKFRDELVSTSELDFDFDVYLTANGRQAKDYALTFCGTMENPIIEVYAEDGTADISEGMVAEAQERISKIELDLGHGVTAVTRMNKGNKVYGTTSRTPEAQDEAVFAEHPDIGDVIHIKAVGLGSSAIKLGGEYRGLYVYDKELNYLGRAGDELPFADKLYLSTKELDVLTELDLETAEPPTETNCAELAEDETENPNMGGDDYAENVNHNPNTGR